MALVVFKEPLQKQVVLNLFWQNKKQKIQQSRMELTHRMRFEHALDKGKW